MLPTLFTNPLLFLLWAVGLVLAISVHEYSHAATADRLGDPTHALKVVSPSTLAHIWTHSATLALLFLGFGWGRPVMFDPYNLRSPRRDSALIALAGPTSNLLFALVLSLMMKFIPGIIILTPVFTVLIIMNISLAIFNLVPIFPLDGEKIIGGILPPDVYNEFSQIMHQYGTIILILMLLPIAGGISPISALISPVISFFTHLLL